MIVKKDQPFSERPIIVVLYGLPGSGKTSLSNTSENNILIDCDRGADRAINKVDTIQANKWSDVLSDESEIQNYSTVTIDTAKSMLDDFLMIHVCDKDNKLKWNKLKAYGAIGEEFKMFVNRRRAEGIDIIIIAHSREEKDGDNITVVPDITGQSKSLLLRIADQVGYISIENGQRVLSFEPDGKHIGKNVAQIQKMIIPNSDDSRFDSSMANIISKIKSMIKSNSDKAIEIEKQKSIEIDNEVSQVFETKTLDELKDLFISLKYRNEPKVYNAKDEQKLKLSKKK